MEDIQFKSSKPAAELNAFVESFWMLKSTSTTGKDLVILPDGRVDLIFSCAEGEPFNVMLMNLDREATQTTLPAKTIMFAVSFKLPALEYILETAVAGMQHPVQMPANFWDISYGDLSDFDEFVHRISERLHHLLSSKQLDVRKQRLFDLLYTSQGSITVKALSDRACWSSRQINRYFQEYVGISLKEYSNILRFRASFSQIKEGRLFPEQRFADQAHFIKSIRKHAGVTPKALSRNKNDRFIQLSALTKD